MELFEIIEIIRAKNSWDSSELIEVLKKKESERIEIKFCYILGYESLKDGTHTEICRSLDEIRILLRDNDIEFDKTIEDPYKLAESVEEEWDDIHNDGGGSGWIEY